MLAFLLRSLVFCAGALWLVGRFPWIEETGINVTLASLEGVFGLLRQPVERHGSAIFALGTSVKVVADCSPTVPFAILAAAMLAFPSTWPRRLLGLAFGAVVIHMFNTVRIYTIIWILAYKKPWFDMVHLYLWQTGMILIVFATFALWILMLAPRPKVP